MVKILLDNGMTQQQIAELAGCTQSLVSQLFTGAVKNTSFDIGLAIMRAYEDVTKDG